MKSVKFEVVELWYNNTYAHYTLVQNSEDATKNYAIKIGNDFFLLGYKDDTTYVCDYKVTNENQ